MKTKKICAAVITLALAGFFSGEVMAKKWNFNYNKGKNSSKKMKLISSFMTDTNNAGKARRISSTVRPGQKIYFYYKVGPVRVIKGRGAPYKTKLVIKKGARTIKDFGWNKANAVRRNQMKRNASFGWFHTTKWHLKLNPRSEPGRYTAVIIHKDQNSRSTIRIRYPFTVTGKGDVPTRRRSGLHVQAELQTFVSLFKRKRLNQVMSYMGTSAYWDGCDKRKMSKRDIRNNLKYLIKRNFRHHTIKNDGRYLYIQFQETRGTRSQSDDPVTIYFNNRNGRLLIREISTACHG